MEQLGLSHDGDCSSLRSYEGVACAGPEGSICKSIICLLEFLSRQVFWLEAVCRDVAGSTNSTNLGTLATGERMTPLLPLLVLYACAVAVQATGRATAAVHLCEAMKEWYVPVQRDMYASQLAACWNFCPVKFSGWSSLLCC